MATWDNTQCMYKQSKSMYNWFKNDQIKWQKWSMKTYCSEKCMGQDWFSGHQFNCEGVQTKYSKDEVVEIESTTPFIKPGKFLDDEELDHNIDLNIDMFEFVDGGK